MTDFRAVLAKIVDETRYFSSEVAEALAEATELLAGDRPTPAAVGEAKKFGALFGRGQQYLSLTRTN